jgi:DDE family transposase
LQALLQLLFMEDTAVDAFLTSSFGTFVITLWQGVLSAPSWQNFTYLASGWALASGRQTITTYLWNSGAAQVKHFSCYYTFLGQALYHRRSALWARVIRCGASLVPADAVIHVRLDDATMKKTGRHIQGATHYRNGAGSARQEYRTLWGINLVWAIMRIPLTRWPGHSLSVPIGLEQYCKEALAKTLTLPYRSRSALARCIVDHVATELPTRRIRVATDGGYATQTFLRALPPNVDVVGRFLLTAKLYHPPPPRVKGQRGAPRKKGSLIGSPKTLATPSSAWHPHPQEAGAFIQSWVGIWHSVLPGRLLRVVVVWRPHLDGPATPNTSKAFGRLKPLEAFFSTDVSLAPAAILETYEDRWAIEIDIRDGHAYYGVAQDQCRKFARIVGANTLRLLLAAARTLWFIVTSEQQADVALQRFRPWYRHKVAPSQFDVAWACREVLQEAGIFPIPRFFPAVAENQQEVDTAKPIAA